MKKRNKIRFQIYFEVEVILRNVDCEFKGIRAKLLRNS